MITFRYIGTHPDLQRQEALGRWDGNHFTVQCNGYIDGGRPTLLVDGEDWAHGWHETPREDWKFVEQPKYQGNLDDAAEFVRANRFTLDCNVFHDGDKYVVFGDRYEDWV